MSRKSGNTRRRGYETHGRIIANNRIHGKFLEQAEFISYLKTMIRLLILALFALLPCTVQAQTYLTLTSPLIGEGGVAPRSMVASRNDCGGENISPPLDWIGAPRGTRSFAMIMFDPDAPKGGFVHWIMLNIPATDHTLLPAAGSADLSKRPDGGRHLNNSYGAKGYDGPCPPLGDPAHHYEFTLYAMPTAYTFYPSTKIGASTLKWFQEHALESARLTVMYKR
jgi:Raf kinase inhibitor-like YbhB/YbcL family protein